MPRSFKVQTCSQHCGEEHRDVKQRQLNRGYKYTEKNANTYLFCLLIKVALDNGCLVRIVRPKKGACLTVQTINIDLIVHGHDVVIMKQPFGRSPRVSPMSQFDILVELLKTLGIIVIPGETKKDPRCNQILVGKQILYNSMQEIIEDGHKFYVSVLQDRMTQLTISEPSLLLNKVHNQYVCIQMA